MPEIVPLSGGVPEDPGDKWPASKVIFGKYELGKLLGCGAFAKVYHARTVKSGQSVAIKAMSKQRILKSGLTTNIMREVDIMRRLRHPHIVRLHEVLATRTKIFFVMEYVKGGELFAKVSKGRLSEDLCRRYFQQLISAVRFCHARGVFHRDLKPENLLLDENGDLKVSDFGLSALADQIRSDGLFHTLCGTPAYVSPEILGKKGYGGAKVDIWSCGVILFVLNAAYLPFNDPNLMVMYRKIYKGEFRCPRWMPLGMKRLLHRILDTNPETRITVDEILQDAWFRRGFKEPEKLRTNEEVDFGLKIDREATVLNAFDLISFSSGFDLSSLFVDSDKWERFVTAVPEEKITTQIDGLGLETRLKKNGRFILEGQNGNFVVGIEVCKLSGELSVLEVKRLGGDAGTYGEFWTEKMGPTLRALAYDPTQPSVLRNA